MLAKQATAIRVARETQIKKDSEHFGAHTPSRTEFPINSYVLIEYPQSSHHKGPPTKFHSNLKGPMQVINVVGSRYTLLNLVTNKLEDFHITQLKQFNYIVR